MLKEFRDFAIKGNVIDLAVGVIIGAAFGKIVTSLVNDILMPPFGMILGRVDFSELYVNLGHQVFDSLKEAQAAGAPTINYGMFINRIIEFVIIAFAIFILVKQLNRLRPPPALPEAAKTTECRYCLTPIPLEALRCPHCTSELGDRGTVKGERGTVEAGVAETAG